MRKLYVYREGQFVEVGKAAPIEGHQIMTDEIPPTVHPCDGKVYTSSSKFREVTRNHGCVEYGNDAPTKNTPREFNLHEGMVEKAYAELSVAGGRNDKYRDTPSFSEYMEKITRG